MAERSAGVVADQADLQAMMATLDVAFGDPEDGPIASESGSFIDDDGDQVAAYFVLTSEQLVWTPRGGLTRSIDMAGLYAAGTLSGAKLRTITVVDRAAYDARPDDPEPPADLDRTDPVAVMAYVEQLDEEMEERYPVPESHLYFQVSEEFWAELLDLGREVGLLDDSDG